MVAPGGVGPSRKRRKSNILRPLQTILAADPLPARIAQRVWDGQFMTRRGPSGLSPSILATPAQWRYAGEAWHSALPLRLSRMRDDGCGGGRAGKAELITGIEGVRRIVLRAV